MKRIADNGIDACESSEGLSFDLIQRFRRLVIPASVSDVREFFGHLTEVAADVFKASLAAAWDNNSYSRYLVLQACTPKPECGNSLYTLDKQRSVTGLAIERCDTVWIDDLTQPLTREIPISHDLMEQLDLRSLISIPIPNPFTPRLTSFVLDLYYSGDGCMPNLHSRLERDWLAGSLGFTLDYLLYQLDESILHTVDDAARYAWGAGQIVDQLLPFFREMTQSDHVTLFRWDQAERRFDLERPSERLTSTDVKDAHVFSNALEDDESAARECLSRNMPVIKDLGTTNRPEAASAADRSRMAVPIHSSSRQVIGALVCRGPSGGFSTPPAFSSYDVHALADLAEAMGPSMERALRLREGSPLTKVVKAMSEAMAQDYELRHILDITIERAVSVLNASIGSVYLLAEDTSTLKMAAGIGKNRHLVDNATYEIGEGITGSIACGQVLNFRTFDELRSHPSYSGKYNQAIWGATDRWECRNFLGVPIYADEQLIGVWKIGDMRPSVEHPDDYFTNEDVQIALVISSFIAAAVTSYRQKDVLSRQFRCLSKTSVNIESADNEQDAIAQLMVGLEESGFSNAMLSLYDADSRMIIGLIASGENWNRIVDATRRPIDGEDILAIVLRNNSFEFIDNSKGDDRCDQETIRIAGIAAQFVLPLRLGDEMIGTLQIDMGTRKSLSDEEKVMLKAFTGHFAVAVSRLRNMRRSVQLAEQVTSSSRFIVAETLSAMAIHSLAHRVDQILRDLQRDLKRREIRQNETLRKSLTDWHGKLASVETDVRNALEFAKGRQDVRGPVDLHPEIQRTIDLWINFLLESKCTVRQKLNAKHSRCYLKAHAFREIVSVLLVNSVQANAKQIVVTTYNDEAVDISSGDSIEEAVCIEFSDDGNGLATNDYESIFSPTYTTKHAKYGTGLGLFIARSLARTGGGDLEVVRQTKPSKGVAFRLLLPTFQEV